MASIFQCALKVISTFDRTVFNVFRSQFFPENLAPALVSLPSSKQPAVKHQSMLEILKDSVVWAVPKKRRTIERRRSRRFGIPKLFYKMLVPKSHILTCPKCGSYYESGLLCSKCYNVVKKETEEMQEAIQAHLGNATIETEVVVLYSGEKTESNPEFYQGKRIVEMKKERPKIFSDNLLQKTTQTPSEGTDIIKTDKIS